MSWEQLVDAAVEARANAYAPYSGFAVGAAVLTEEGGIYSGCNVENRTFGLAICAERVALAKAVADGARGISAVAVVADASPPARPCGLCLQAMVEFTDDIPVLLVNTKGDRQELRLSQLLPDPFVLPGNR